MSATVNPTMSWDDYFAHPALSSTGARLLLSSTPAHYRYGDPIEGKALEIGRAIHMLVLEPDVFARAYRIMEKPSGTGMKAAKESILNEAVADGVTVLWQDDAEMVLAMRESIWRSDIARKMLERAQLEQSILWECPEFGIPMKARLDVSFVLPSGGVMIFDLKTCRCARKQEFERTIYNYGYHVQAATYMEAAEAVDMDPRSFVFICAEKQKPFPVALYELDSNAIELGRDYLRKAKRIYADCLASGVWPAYSDKIEPISIPEWAMAREEFAAMAEEGAEQ